MSETSVNLDLFGSQTEASPSRLALVFKIEIPGRLPSWNDILGMEQWARYKFKQELADAFLCALRRSEGDCSTKTTSAKNITSIFADTLERYLRTRREERRLRSLKKKLAQKSQSSSESKSTGKVPF